MPSHNEGDAAYHFCRVKLHNERQFQVAVVRVRFGYVIVVCIGQLNVVDARAGNQSH